MVHIRQAFEGLREENDGTSSNEVRLIKLQQFPFFNRQDLARLPQYQQAIAETGDIRKLLSSQDENERQKGGYTIQKGGELE